MTVLRSVARSRAKEKMHRKGMRRICSKGRRGTSWFSLHWREYVD